MLWDLNRTKIHSLRFLVENVYLKHVTNEKSDRRLVTRKVQKRISIESKNYNLPWSIFGIVRAPVLYNVEIRSLIYIVITKMTQSSSRLYSCDIPCGLFKLFNFLLRDAIFGLQAYRELYLELLESVYDKILSFMCIAITKVKYDIIVI